MNEEKTVNKSGMTMDQKAKDLKTSGAVLIAVGGVGLLCVILAGFGVIPFRMQGIMKFISVGVMGFLFLVFLISGFGALKRSKSAAADAVRENEKREEILKWFSGEYDADLIDEAIRNAPVPEETVEETEEETAEEAVEETGEEIPDETGEENAEEDGEEISEEDGDQSEYTDEDMEENELYFERTAFIQAKIKERFLELDEALLSDITERLYSDIFG